MKLTKKVLTPGANLLYKLFRYLLLIGVSYVVLFPIIKMVSASITMPDELYQGDSGFIPNEPTFVNFVKSQSYFKYGKFLGHTLKIALIGTFFQIVSCSLVGYGLGRYNFKGNPIVYGAVLFTIILPVQTYLIPAFYEYRWFDLFGIGSLIGLFTGQTYTVSLLGNHMAMIFPTIFAVGLNSGIYIFLFRQFFASMPKDLEEAAKIDGCNPLKIYLKVMLPNIKPVIVTVALLSVIYFWNDTLSTGSFIANRDDMTLMVALEEMMVRNTGLGLSELDAARRDAERYAVMLTIVTPLMVLFMIGQKFFVECMDRSGSKG